MSEESILRFSPVVWAGVALGFSVTGMLNLATGWLGERWLSIVALVVAIGLLPLTIRTFNARHLPRDEWLEYVVRLPQASQARERVKRVYRVGPVGDLVAAILLLGVAIWSLVDLGDVMLTVIFLGIALFSAYMAMYESALRRLAFGRGGED